MTHLRAVRRTAIAALLLVPLPGAAARAQGPTLAQAGWLHGCWERVTGNRRRVERWLAPTAGEMRGDSRSFADTVETGGERLRLAMVDNRLTYFAHPSNQLAQSFTAKDATPSALTFENLAHDFPQRIVYERRGVDSLVARIEGDRAGRQPPVTFAFRRISCAGLTASPADLAQEALTPLYEDLTRRLRAHPSGTPGWFVAHAAPGFAYANFAAPGYLGRVGGLAAQEAAARAVAAAAAPTIADYAVSVEIAAVLVRGDTAQVMAVIQQGGRTGPAGQQRLRSSRQRRLDRWVRAGDAWKLVAATTVDTEDAVDGVPTARNGVPLAPSVPPVPPAR